MKIGVVQLVSTWLLLTLHSSLAVGSEENAEYGADVSFPVHHEWTDLESIIANAPDVPVEMIANRKAVYDDFMDGCRDHYGYRGNRCDQNEIDRIEMTLRQPQSMVNYTATGFMKIRAPEALRKLLTDHWERNKINQRAEQWTAGNIYTNHWASPTYMVSVEDTNLRGGGMLLKNAIWDAAKDTIEQWTGMEQQPTSQYGIRVYTEGAILSPHVDRLPLVSSAIVNVAQDVDEPWPLEVYDREGNAVNVTMEPGDMVLYESHSLIHGRPFPLKGRYFANIFIHFEPTGQPLYHKHEDDEDDFEGDLPPYILRGSPEDDNWRRRNPDGWKNPSPSAAHVDMPKGHMAAAAGDIEVLSSLAKEDKTLLHYKDKNGWQPIHEAARAGHTDAVKLLIDLGADMNARTHEGKGGTPLHVALNTLSEKHAVSQFLLSIGALNIGPDL